MLSIYLSQVIKTSKLKVTGQLNRSRDFIYISDIVAAMTNLKLLKNKKTNIFNLGQVKEVSVQKLIKINLQDYK